MPEIPPIDPTERLYRRVSADHFKPGAAHPDFVAVNATKHDTDGMSLFRANLKDAKDVALASAKPGKEYFVAEVGVADFVAAGQSVVTDDMLPPSDEPLDPAHVTIPGMNADNRRSEPIKEIARGLALNCKMHGPYKLADDAGSVPQGPTTTKTTTASSN